MTVADIIKKLQELPPQYEVAVETQEGVSEIHELIPNQDRTYKLSVDYSGDYHELRELENNEVSVAMKIPGIIIFKPIEE